MLKSSQLPNSFFYVRPISRISLSLSLFLLKVRMAGSVGKKASALVASDPDKKRLAEKSFTSYVRAVQLMPNKQV